MILPSMVRPRGESGALAATAPRGFLGGREVAPTTPWMEEVESRREQRPRAALPQGSFAWALGLKACREVGVVHGRTEQPDVVHLGTGSNSAVYISSVEDSGPKTRGGTLSGTSGGFPLHLAPRSQEVPDMSVRYTRPMLPAGSGFPWPW